MSWGKEQLNVQAPNNTPWLKAPYSQTCTDTCGQPGQVTQDHMSKVPKVEEVLGTCWKSQSAVPKQVWVHTANPSTGCMGSVLRAEGFLGGCSCMVALRRTRTVSQALPFAKTPDE
eukprot:597695-Amphidinium_carterae.1